MFGKFEALLVVILIVLVVCSDQRSYEFARKVSQGVREFINKRNEAS